MEKINPPRVRLNHIMLRVKDPKKSLPFYEDVLGFTVTREEHYEEGAFSLYFLSEKNAPAGSVRIELTHNHGTENDPDFSYHNGNVEPRGYGHLCFDVPDLAEAVAYFDTLGVKFVKRPEEGVMRDIAFIEDPDGYRIEIIESSREEKMQQATQAKK